MHWLTHFVLRNSEKTCSTGRVNYSRIYNAFIFFFFFLPHFPSSIPFLGNQPGQICSAQRTVCGCLFLCVCVCVGICLCVVPVWKILEGRLETKIGEDRENKSATLPPPNPTTHGKSRWHISDDFQGFTGLERRYERIMCHRLVEQEQKCCLRPSL